MPQLTKVWHEIETLRDLIGMEGIVGIKDSSGDMDYFARVCQLKQQRPDWSVMVGPEAKLGAAHHRGGDGGVCGGANVMPRLFVECYESLRDGDEQTYQKRQAAIERFQAIYEIGKYASRHIKATETAC